MKHVLNAIEKAAHETAAYMTFDVRKSAHAHGWNNHESSSLRVRYQEGNFSVNAEGDHAEHALNKEYGTEEHRPTAVMRKYGNHYGKAESIFMQQLNKHIGGLL